MKPLIASLISKQLKMKKEEIEILIEIPPSPDFGDYAFPCFSLAKQMRKPPTEISIELARKLQVIMPKEISEIKSVGPYVNFFIDKKFLVEDTIKKILADKNKYGSLRMKGKILVEHTSVNPNASPHVGRARNSVIGDSIVRILKFSGNKVETHYYVNDVSKQVAMLSLAFTGKEKFSDMLNKYMEISAKIEKNPKLEKQVFEILNKFEHKEKKTTEKIRKIVNICIQGQKKILADFGINFDYFDYESKYLNSGKEILKQLEKTGKLFKDKDGRFVLNQQGTPVERKMKAPYFVLTRSDGTGLYPLRDLAYTTEKIKKGRNIIVLGEDQKLYFEQIKETLKLLGKQAPEVVHYSLVLIESKEGKTKMSTRKGELVLLEEFMEEAVKKAKQEINKRKTKGDAKKIAIAAIKFAMLRNENNKNIIFNWQQSLNFEGESGPYLLYSYARASSIIRKSRKKPGKFEIKNLDEKEINLIKKLSQFKEIVEHAYKQLEPSIIANYSFQLAQVFNEFYHSCQVIDNEAESFRLAIVEAFRIVMKSSLSLLGIEAIEEM